jgi:hypothetical protein
LNVKDCDVGTSGDSLLWGLHNAFVVCDKACRDGRNNTESVFDDANLSETGKHVKASKVNAALDEPSTQVVQKVMASAMLTSWRLHSTCIPLNIRIGTGCSDGERRARRIA